MCYVIVRGKKNLGIVVGAERIVATRRTKAKFIRDRRRGFLFFSFPAQMTPEERNNDHLINDACRVCAFAVRLDSVAERNNLKPLSSDILASDTK